jgi:hypothetical protein
MQVATDVDYFSDVFVNASADVDIPGGPVQERARAKG